MEEGKKRKQIIRISLAAMLVILVFTLFSTPASAAELHVGSGQTYSTIQAAIDAASPGDTVIVHDGTYTENVDVDKSNLTIRSQNGSDVTTVTAASVNDHVFAVTRDYVNISGFTVTGATSYYYSTVGIYLSVSVDHCYVSDNNASNNKYGIYLDYWSHDNTLTNNTASNNDWGIRLDHSSDNTLTNNIVNSNKWEGIYLDYSSDNTLTSNTVSSNQRGIYLDDSSDNTLTNNTVSSNSSNGIQLSSSSHNTLMNNNASNNNYGISLGWSHDNMLQNNNASNNSYGIYLASSRDNTLTNNTMSGNEYNFGVYGGNRLSDFLQNIDTSNKINGKTIYYWVNQQDKQVPNDAGFVGIVNSTNITVRDLVLTKNYEAVLFAYTENSRIENVKASNNEHGIRLHNSGNIALTNNIASNNNYGIYLSYSCNYNTLTNNTANSNNIGIYLEGSYYLVGGPSNNTFTNNTANSNHRGISLWYYPSNNTFTNNTANSNHHGISLSNSCNNNTFTNNTANSNSGRGISLGNSCKYNTFTNNTANSNYYEGISLYYSCKYNTFTNNTANLNNGYGIYLIGSSNTFTNNTANSNSDYGLYLGGSSNTFTSNTASNNNYGIYLSGSSNTLMDNTVSNNSYGIYLYSAGNNTLTNNIISGNEYNFGVGGHILSYYIHDIDTSNKVDTKPIYYWVNQKDQQVPNDAGFVGIVNSTNITVRDLVLTKNYEGVLFAYTENSRIENVTVSNNSYGIYMWRSSDNTFSNDIASNNAYGIYLIFSDFNLIYNNYFDNTNNAYDNGNNLWNTTKTAGTNIICGPYLGGNYWSDYKGNDTDEDGIGDTLLPYNTGITNGGDWLPLTRTNVSVETSTGTGTATFSTDSGEFADINGVDETSLPQEAKDNKPEGLTLPHGLFKFTITELTPGQSVTLTITLPSPVLVDQEWWKVNTTAGNNTWYSLPIGDNDGDNVVTIALTDGGLGDIDGAANGVIVDPSGIGEVALPDLVIFDKWVNTTENCTICYNVTNIGNGTALAGHNTTLYVDGVEVARDYVPEELTPGENYTGCFDDYNWIYTPPEDNITVCADINNTIAESNETNNCRTNTWMCGDVNEDHTVNVLDVLGVYRRALDPNYQLKVPWAGDVNGDGTINVLDVLGVYRKALDPGYDLGCCCG